MILPINDDYYTVFKSSRYVYRHNSDNPSKGQMFHHLRRTRRAGVVPGHRGRVMMTMIDRNKKRNITSSVQAYWDGVANRGRRSSSGKLSLAALSGARRTSPTACVAPLAGRAAPAAGTVFGRSASSTLVLTSSAVTRWVRSSRSSLSGVASNAPTCRSSSSIRLFAAARRTAESI